LYLNLWVGLDGVDEKIKWKTAFNHCIINHLFEIYYKFPTSEPPDNVITKYDPKNADNTLESYIFKTIHDILEDKTKAGYYFQYFYHMIFNSKNEPVIESECGICFGCDIKVVLSCNHQLCFSCFLKTALNKLSCPFCRNVITFENSYISQSIINYKNYFDSFGNSKLFLTTHISIYNYLVSQKFDVIHPKFMNISNLDNIVSLFHWKELIILGNVSCFSDFVWKIAYKFHSKHRKIFYFNV